MTELREVTGQRGLACVDRTCAATLANVIVRQDCDGDARKAAVAVLSMNLALTAELGELTGKRAYERAGAVHRSRRPFGFRRASGSVTVRASSRQMPSSRGVRAYPRDALARLCARPGRPIGSGSLIETLGRAHQCGWKITVRCAHSREDHAGKSARECYHRYELDISKPLLWARGVPALPAHWLRETPALRLAPRRTHVRRPANPKRAASVTFNHRNLVDNKIIHAEPHRISIPNCIPGDDIRQPPASVPRDLRDGACLPRLCSSYGPWRSNDA
jgi:hypothetical protein